MNLSIVIPCYNEQNNILPLYELIKYELDKYDYQIIFINDGSNDDTLLNLKTIYNQDSNNISIIDFSRNFGKEAAILAGLEYAKGDYVSIIDADLQQHPRYIKQMVEFLEQNSHYDAVAAYQVDRSEGKVLSGFKKLFYKSINKMTDIDIVQSASDFRTFRPNVVKAILSLKERCRFSKGIFSWVGYSTYYMPYKAEKRANGNTKWSFWKLTAYAIDGIVAFSTMPLIISSIIGVVICLLAFIFMMVIIFKTIIWGDPVAGFPTLAVIVLFSSGIQLFFLGILGQYIAKSYTENKQRPHYIIKEYLKKD